MDPSSSPTFAQVLRDLRVAAGLSQEALAQRSGLSLRGISDLERGLRRTPRLETVRMLADGLALGPAERHALLAAARPRSLAPLTGSSQAAGVPRLLAPPVGREREVEDITGLLLDDVTSLVTLTGPGGVGKTTLAIAVAHAIAGRFADGVVYVPLGVLIDPRLVVLSLGEALGVRQASLAATTEAVQQVLRRRHALLVLDNFEHVMDAATVVARLVDGCPNLKILVTSRERLRIRGERVVLVHPLALPDARASLTLDSLGDVPSVQLFLQRVREGAPEFALSGETAAVVAAICRRLDGLPLALELAASWMRILTPSALLERLDQRLPLLERGPRDAQQRHQTLGSTIAWSYQLLSASEQAMFRRLGVFVGGFDLPAIEAIAADAEPPEVTMETLAALVDKSLVRRLERGPAVRFTMLETVREFALAQLDAAGERDRVEARHAAWYVALGERMQEHLLREIDFHWLDGLEVDHGNVRDALVWTLVTCSDAANARLGLRLARSIWLFWYYHSHLAEGRFWLERALAATGTGHDADRAMALVWLGTLANAQGDEDTALRCLTEGLAMAREAGDPTVIAFALSVMGNWAEDSARYDDARRFFSEANAIFTEIHDTVNVSITNYHLGVVAFGQGRMEEAERRCLDSLALSQGRDDAWGTAASIAQLGLVRTTQGELEQAASDLDRALTLYVQIGSPERIADTLYRIAALASASQAHEAAVHLFANADRLRVGIGAAIAFPERDVYEAAEVRSRAVLGRAMVTPDRALDDIIEDAHLVLMNIVGPAPRRDSA